MSCRQLIRQCDRTHHDSVWIHAPPLLAMNPMPPCDGSPRACLTVPQSLKGFLGFGAAGIGQPSERHCSFISFCHAGASWTCQCQSTRICKESRRTDSQSRPQGPGCRCDSGPLTAINPWLRKTGDVGPRLGPNERHPRDRLDLGRPDLKEPEEEAGYGQCRTDHPFNALSATRPCNCWRGRRSGWTLAEALRRCFKG